MAADPDPRRARLFSVAPHASAAVGTDWTPALDTSTDGTAFSRLCPSGSAVSGLRGRSGVDVDVDAIQVECRQFGAKAVLTGDPTYPARVGGTGGLARDAYRCGTNDAAFSLYGRSGTTMRRPGLRCRRATF